MPNIDDVIADYKQWHKQYQDKRLFHESEARMYENKEKQCVKEIETLETAKKLLQKWRQPTSYDMT